MFKAIADWQGEVMENSEKNDNTVVYCAKAIGMGLLEGAVIGCTVLGAMLLASCATVSMVSKSVK